MSLDELGLTPLQLVELERLEQPLIEAWLGALAHTDGLRSPVGWFLAGVRSGTFPGAIPDNELARRLLLADRRLAHIGHELPTEAEVLEEFFLSRGALLERFDSAAIRARMFERWAPMHKLGNERTGQAHTTQSLHTSQTSAALTAVSADSDPDADIPW